MTTIGNGQMRRMPSSAGIWRDLPWLIPAALATWTAILIVFVSLIEFSPRHSSHPLDVGFIETPAGSGGDANNAQSVTRGGAPAAGLAPERSPRAAVKPRKFKPLADANAVPTSRAHPEPMETSYARDTTSRDSSPNTASPPSPLDSRGDKITSLTGGRGGPAPGEFGQANGSGTGGSGAGPGGGAGTGIEPVYTPLPQIPDDLRKQALDTFVIARFTVAHDGAATVALITPTSDDRLNQIVLEKLQEWRFKPATRAGQPIDAVAQMKIRIEVR